MYRVEDFVARYKTLLELSVFGGSAGLKRKIKSSKVDRPGLSLIGYTKIYDSSRILIFGRIEIAYLKEMKSKKRRECLKRVITSSVPFVIVARGLMPPKELLSLCEKMGITVLSSNMATLDLQSRMIFMLINDLSPTINLQGTMVEVFGVGVVIQGSSAIGKSEAALGLLERGHRLVSDDIVQVKKKENVLIGFGQELTRYLMEIRGIGIINVSHLYGAVCVRQEAPLDVLVKLESWDDKQPYDRLGLDESYLDVLGVNVPYHILPVKIGRDLPLLIETLALNHRLKTTGSNAAKELISKLGKTIKEKG